MKVRASFSVITDSIFGALSQATLRGLGAGVIFFDLECRRVKDIEDVLAEQGGLARHARVPWFLRSYEDLGLLALFRDFRI